MVKWSLLGVALAAIPAGGALAQDVCQPGALILIEHQGAARVGYVLDGPLADGSCLIEFAGLLYDWTEQLGAQALASGNATIEFLPPLSDETVTEALPPVEAPAVGHCAIGQPVDILWQGSWYPGQVLDGPRGDGACYITYDGYDSSWDEWAAPSRLRPVAASDLCQPGRPVSIEWRGSWYPGRVLDGPGGDGSCKVGYDGYDSSWDEWVMPGRLRPGH